MLKGLDRIKSVLGILDLEPPKVDQDVEALIEQREQARKNKDWDTADLLRQELKEMGVEVIDTKEGPGWRKVRN